MARKTPDTSVRVSADFGELLRRAAGIRGMSIAEYAREVLAPIVQADLVAEAKKIAKDPSPPKR